jgi:hypothetical protein
VNGSCHIIIDESGNLSSTVRSPRHFVLAALCVRNDRQVQRIPRNVRKKFSKKINIGVELKHTKENEVVSTFILSSLASLDVNIHWVALRKSYKKEMEWYRAYEALSYILLRELTVAENALRYYIFVDRISKKSSHMASYVAMVDQIFSSADVQKTTPLINIKFVDSRLEPAMQVHDFVVGSIFRSLEWDDYTHLDIIKDKVVFGKIVAMKDLFRHRHEEHGLQEK